MIFRPEIRRLVSKTVVLPWSFSITSTKFQWNAFILNFAQAQRGRAKCRGREAARSNAKRFSPMAKRYGFIPSGLRCEVLSEANDDLCSGRRWYLQPEVPIFKSRVILVQKIFTYLMASRRSSLHSVLSLTNASVSTWVIKNSREIRGSLTCFMSWNRIIFFCNCRC